MARFSTKRMLVGVTVVAIGCGLIAYTIQHRGDQPIPQTLWQWTAGGAIIGAGLLTPLRLTLFGALIGFLLLGGLALYAYHNFPIC